MPAVPVPKPIVLDASAPAASRAATLTHVILDRVGFASWDEMGAAIKRGEDAELKQRVQAVALDIPQKQLLEQYAPLVRLMRHKIRGAKPGEPGSIAITVAVCPECQEWFPVKGGQGGVKCPMTQGCTGKTITAPVTARAAKAEAVR